MQKCTQQEMHGQPWTLERSQYAPLHAEQPAQQLIVGHHKAAVPGETEPGEANAPQHAPHPQPCALVHNVLWLLSHTLNKHLSCHATCAHRVLLQLQLKVSRPGPSSSGSA